MSFSLGPFGFSYAHLAFFISIALTFLIGYGFSRKLNKSLGDFLFRIIAVTLITARFGYVIQYWEQYQTSLLQIFNVRDGGFNLWVGVIAGALMLVWECWRHKKLTKQLVTSSVTGLSAFLILIFVHDAWLYDPPDMPNLSLEHYSGESFTLTDEYLGEPTVINLWASWCGPCVKEMPILERAQQEHSNVNIVIVNQGENRQTVAEFLSEHELQFAHNVLDQRTQFSTLLKAYVLPTTLFFNAEGKLVDNHIGELSPARLSQGIAKTTSVIQE